jgi:hypothetical protein
VGLGFKLRASGFLGRPSTLHQLSNSVSNFCKGIFETISHINYKYILISDLNTQQTSICHFSSDIIFEFKNITVVFGGWGSARA